MYIERLVFNVKYGKDLVSVLKKGNEMMAKRRLGKGRILTDLTGKMFTVVWEYRVRNLDQWEKARKNYFADPAFQRWFKEMEPLVESGHREFYAIEAE